MTGAYYGSVDLPHPLAYYRGAQTFPGINYPQDWVVYVEEDTREGKNIVAFRSLDQNEAYAFANELRVQIEGVRRLMGLKKETR